MFVAPFQVLEALAVAYSTANTLCTKTEADNRNIASFYCEDFSESLTLTAERAGIVGDAVQFEQGAAVTAVAEKLAQTRCSARGT